MYQISEEIKLDISLKYIQTCPRLS